MNLHPCLLCNNANNIYFSQSSLLRHIKAQHNQTRIKTNLELFTNTYRNTPSQPWLNSLQTLHHLQPQPPPFRLSLWHSLSSSDQHQYLQTLSHAIQWTLTATIPYCNPNPSNPQPIYQLTPAPFWKLLLILEPLLLNPLQLPNRHRMQPHEIFTARLSMFKRGDITTLIDHMYSKDLPLIESSTQPLFDPFSEAPAAQRAADSNNFHTAYARVRSITPLASFDKYRPIIEKLYPPKREFYKHTHIPKPNTLSYIPHIPVNEKALHQTISKLQRGKAAGPFADITDPWRALATYSPPVSDPTAKLYTPYYHLLQQLLELIINNQIPSTIQPLLSSNYSIYLHKDQSNLSKIRPIGIGTALRRIAGKLLITQHALKLSTIFYHPDNLESLLKAVSLSFYTPSKLYSILT